MRRCRSRSSSATKSARSRPTDSATPSPVARLHAALRNVSRPCVSERKTTSFTRWSHTGTSASGFGCGVTRGSASSGVLFMSGFGLTEGLPSKASGSSAGRRSRFRMAGTASLPGFVVGIPGAALPAAFPGCCFPLRARAGRQRPAAQAIPEHLTVTEAAPYRPAVAAHPRETRRPPAAGASRRVHPAAPPEERARTGPDDHWSTTSASMSPP